MDGDSSTGGGQPNADPTPQGEGGRRRVPVDGEAAGDTADPVTAEPVSGCSQRIYVAFHEHSRTSPPREITVSFVDSGVPCGVLLAHGGAFKRLSTTTHLLLGVTAGG